MSKSDMQRQITVAEMAPHIHSFGANENKVLKLAGWLSSWIKDALKSGKIKPYDLLPRKGDLAFHIGVSQGTVQNAFRYVEDEGIIESKQRIGTYIKNPEAKKKIKKLTSKRETAAGEIKKYIVENSLSAGSILISSRNLAGITGFSPATVRIALSSLINEGILKKEGKVFVIKSKDFTVENIKNKTLAEKIAENIMSYVEKNNLIGKKLPTNSAFAKMYGVSVKTVHDAIKLLIKDGYLFSRRGRYGTIALNSSQSLNTGLNKEQGADLNKIKENLVFSDAENIVNNPDELYYYEKVELKIKHYIMQNCGIGTKLPSIVNFAQMFNVSSKTVKKALDNLSADGYVAFSRGRFGGTFVTDIPERVEEAYKWLALNSEYFKNTDMNC